MSLRDQGHQLGDLSWGSLLAARYLLTLKTVLGDGLLHREGLMVRCHSTVAMVCGGLLMVYLSVVLIVIISPINVVDGPV